MKSTIRIKQDFDRNEPFIQLKLDTANPDQDVDLVDSVLIHFVELASNRGLELTYPDRNNDYRIVEIRLKP